MRKFQGTAKCKGQNHEKPWFRKVKAKGNIKVA